MDSTIHDLPEQLRMGQSHLLEMIAKSMPLTDTLNSLMLLIESQSLGLYCSILLLDEDNIHVRPGAGPNLPASYMEALDGYPIGPMVGSCGTAMYRKEAVVVTDLLEDPLWTPYKGLIAPHGFRACWSTPIFLNREQVLGAFAMYYKEVRSPGPHEMNLIGVATHIAGIAIERTRREQEIDRHRNHLEELVAARTAELSAAKELTDQSNHALSMANQELASALNTLSITQEELVRRDKLAALGALVAGVAHELNTPIGNGLTVASTLTEHAQSFSAQYAKGLTRGMLEDFILQTNTAGELLVRNLQRAAGLVGSFKQVAVEQSSSQRQAFSLRALVNSMDLLQLHPGMALELQIPDDLSLDSYPGPLTDVVLHLVNNAVLHGYADCAVAPIKISAHRTQDGWLELCVEDQGTGIFPANVQRLFDPFFTTKLGSGSSGLGLYITHNIVTSILGGSISAHSIPGDSTRFVLLLPLVTPVFQHALEAERGAQPPARDLQ